ncbi:diguanylate cyclase (GGDEF)-like protein [Pelomonas saccharophila]|uniref:diguanylate cyclase n=1 Tax=Roseateles saccharophilus TaxID=304 RepID=A0ABU1YVP9_ROSSA|nr:GGDEF domain-containing protein [Roseateles saccharophilus]MDR7272928.1 diguanylate cyclase (GGDEF)-like protein [Roseateles saccharophilus]
MSTDSPAETLDRVSPRRLGSLRLRFTVAVPLLTAFIVTVFEWSLGGFEAPAEGVAHAAWLVLLLSAAQLLLIEALLLRPLRQLAAGCEAMESAPTPLTPDVQGTPRLTAELDRIGHAMRRARGSLWQQDQDARELRRELTQQRHLLEEAHAALEANQRELASLARVDPLTGIANQRAFDEALRREFKRAQRQRGLLALAVLDLDQFKQFNLAHGTDIGDAALQRVASLLNERFKRDTDVVARLGGEEFVALLPGFGMAEAQGVLESLRDELRALRLPDGQGGLTLSVGLAAASPAHPYLSAQALLQAADEALYIAKHAGRDRLSLAA